MYLSRGVPPQPPFLGFRLAINILRGEGNNTIQIIFSPNSQFRQQEEERGKMNLEFRGFAELLETFCSFT